MKMLSTSWALLSIIGIVLYTLSFGNCLKSNEYDHFTYTQQWPQGACECTNGNGNTLVYRDECRIPENVKTWTVHGLWPTLGKSEKPSFCNHSWPFEESQILDIEEKMKIFWPKLFFATRISKLLISKAIAVSGSRISFWEHEWEKHGTCSTDLSILNSEHKYFSAGLDLNRKYDLLSWLSDKGIVPSKTKTYQLADIRKIVMSNVKSKPYMHCCKTNGKQRIQELMICLNKQLKPIDCVEDDEDCTDDVPVSYEPIVPY